MLPLVTLVCSLHLDTCVLRSRCHPAHQQRTRNVSRMAVTGPDDEMKVTVRIKKPSPEDAGPPPSPSTLAIEATFVQAASGANGANYEFSLMEFIRATRDAYDEGITVPALNLELSMCKQYTAGRPLQPEEIDLRSVWLSLVYLTFERVGYASSTGTFPGESVAADLRQKFYTFTVRFPPSTPTQPRPPHDPYADTASPLPFRPISTTL